MESIQQKDKKPFYERMIKLEWELSNHTQDINELHKISRDLNNNIGTIKTSLNQIKWFILGAGSFMVLQEIGLIEFLKKVIF